MAVENHHQRQEKAKRRFDLKALPYRHESSLVADANLAEDQGIGHALRAFQQTEQQNFDHLAEEVRRWGLLFNEREADTEYLKESYEDHEQVPVSPPRTSLQGHSTWLQSWSEFANVTGEGGDRLDDSGSINVVPFFAGENMHISRMEMKTGAGARNVNAVYDPDPRMYFAIYNGDNRGNFPGSLLADLGLVDGGASASGIPGQLTMAGSRFGQDCDVDLQKGRWYYLAYALAPEANFPYDLPFGTPCITGDPQLEDLPFLRAQTTNPMNFLGEADSDSGDVADYFVGGLSYFSPFSVATTDPFIGFPDNLPYMYYDLGNITPDRITGPYYQLIGTFGVFLKVD